MTEERKIKREINLSKYVLSNYDEILSLLNKGRYFSYIVNYINEKLGSEGYAVKLTENNLRSALHRIKNNTLKPIDYKNAKQEETNLSNLKENDVVNNSD